MSRRREAARGDGSLLVWGVHACQAALARAATDVLELWLREDASQPELAALAATAARLGLRPQRVPATTLDRLTDGAVHQGVVLRRRPPAPLDLAALRAKLAGAARTPLVLALDHPQDPHNLGACLRVADGAGADAVLLPRDRSVGLTAAAAKVASGAADSMPICAVANLIQALEALKQDGLWIVGATGDAPGTLYAADLRVPLVLVLGAESDGLRRLTRASCDLLVSIPMAGSVASLNLATAAAVCLFEARRQRLSV
ncbi:MAG TPA: 23S rRNA (guanosine(2251)-2'-O)-methyltransferase RlmB [Gammaproteobacteria bacterium]|nr:23S rRNA (guanosine(2251)-2'-O)-methyltransferase RlmB [Gammaproteobacteria bacterium]